MQKGGTGGTDFGSIWLINWNPRASGQEWISQSIPEASLANSPNQITVVGTVLPGKEEQVRWFRQARLWTGDSDGSLLTARNPGRSLPCQTASIRAANPMSLNRCTRLQPPPLKLAWKAGLNTVTGFADGNSGSLYVISVPRPSLATFK
jgi:hypothetical protein